MLPIVLTILKIIGIVILAVMGLLFLILLLVLLVPVRYSLSGSYYSAIKAQAKITWLLHALSLGITYEDELNISVRVLGIPLFQKKEDGKDTLEHLEETAENLEEETVCEAGNAADVEICSLGEDGHRDEVCEEEDILPEDDCFEEAVPKSPKSRKRKKSKKKRESSDRKKGSLSERIKGLAGSVRETWNRAGEYKERVTAFVTDQENQKTFRLILRQLKAMIRHVLPVKARGKLTFGFEDPCTTGNVLAIFAVLYAWYEDAVQITPVFDEQILEGEGSLKGRIRAGTLLVFLIRIILNKNFRVLVKRWRRNGGI